MITRNKRTVMTKPLRQVAETAGGKPRLGAGGAVYKIARGLHFLGLAMFLGSILGHITLGLVPGANNQPQAMLVGRQAIQIATWSLTVPGLALLVVTGLFLTLRGGWGFGRRRWLAVHQIIGVLILLNAGLMLVPIGGDLLDVASKIVQGSASLEDFAALKGRESAFGAGNLMLALITIFVAVLKPALGQSRA